VASDQLFSLLLQTRWLSLHCPDQPYPGGQLLSALAGLHSRIKIGIFTFLQMGTVAHVLLGQDIYFLNYP
jgi:hypothetical protein